MAKIIQFSDFGNGNQIDDSALLAKIREGLAEQFVLENTKTRVGNAPRIKQIVECANYIHNLICDPKNETTGEVKNASLDDFVKTDAIIECVMKKVSVNNVPEFISKVETASDIEFVPKIKNEFNFGLTFQNAAMYVDKDRSDDER